MSLIDEVNEKRKEIRTDGYAMSISEWASLYENNTLIQATHKIRTFKNDLGHP